VPGVGRFPGKEFKILKSKNSKKFQKRINGKFQNKFIKNIFIKKL